jgi:hypothetical protein
MIILMRRTVKTPTSPSSCDIVLVLVIDANPPRQSAPVTIRSKRFHYSKRPSILKLMAVKGNDFPQFPRSEGANDERDIQ